MVDQQVWAIEERFWLEGSGLLAEALHPQCVMVFPAPVGVMHGDAIARSLEGTPRWSEVAMAERMVGRPDDGTVVLAYRVEGRRVGAVPYVAYCSSTYRVDGERCRLVQHQQTPV